MPYRALLNFALDNVEFEPLVFGSAAAGSAEQVAYPALVPRDAVLADDHPVVTALRRLSDPFAPRPLLRPDLVSFNDYLQEVED